MDGGRGEEVLDMWVEGSYGHNLSNVGGFKAEGIQAEFKGCGEGFKDFGFVCREVRSSIRSSRTCR